MATAYRLRLEWSPAKCVHLLCTVLQHTVEKAKYAFWLELFMVDVSPLWRVCVRVRVCACVLRWGPTSFPHTKHRGYGCLLAAEPGLVLINTGLENEGQPPFLQVCSVFIWMPGGGVGSLTPYCLKQFRRVPLLSSVFSVIVSVCSVGDISRPASVYYHVWSPVTEPLHLNSAYFKNCNQYYTHDKHSQSNISYLFCFLRLCKSQF